MIPATYTNIVAITTRLIIIFFMPKFYSELPNIRFKFILVARKRFFSL